MVCGLWFGKGVGYRRNVQRFRRGLLCEAHRRVYHSTLGWRVIKKYRKALARGGRGRGGFDCRVDGVWFVVC